MTRRIEPENKATARTQIAASLAADREAQRVEDAARRASDPDYAALAERRDKQSAAREIARIEKRMTARIQRASGITGEIADMQARIATLTDSEPRRVPAVADQLANRKFELSDLRREIKLDEELLARLRKATA